MKTRTIEVPGDSDMAKVLDTWARVVIDDLQGKYDFFNNREKAPGPGITEEEMDEMVERLLDVPGVVAEFLSGVDSILANHDGGDWDTLTEGIISMLSDEDRSVVKGLADSLN